MKVYIVIKDNDIPNPYDRPNRELVEIDCIKATEDGAFERMRELIREGYRNADIRIKYLT